MTSKYTRPSRDYMNSFSSPSLDIDAVTDELERELSVTSEDTKRKEKRSKYIRNQNSAYMEAEKNKLKLDEEEIALKSCNSFTEDEQRDYLELKDKTTKQTERLTNNTDKVKEDIKHGDSYVSAINRIINNLEEVYGLRKLIHGVPVMDLGIDDVRQNILPKLNKNHKELNGQAGKYIVELSYLSDRLEFFGYDKVDFRCYKFLETVLPVLFSFSTAERVKSLSTEKGIKDISKIFIVLKIAEDDNKKFIKALGYRLLRLFSILIYHNNVVDAGIIAKFILLQMALSDIKGAKERRNLNQYNNRENRENRQNYRRTPSSYSRVGRTNNTTNNERSNGRYRRDNPRTSLGNYNMSAFQ